MTDGSASGLSLETFTKAVPFHIVVEPDPASSTISPRLRRYWSLEPGDDADGITLIRPFAAPLQPRMFPELTDMVLTLAHARRPDRQVRGELIDAGDGRWVLSCMPAVSSVTDLAKSELHLTDLSLASGLGDALIAVEAANVSLLESRDALGTLERTFHELEATTETFRRFVPTPFLEAIGAHSVAEARLGLSATLEMTVMFADLRGFDTIRHMIAGDDVVELVNRYLALAAPAISDHGGFVIEYAGDGIIALFGGSTHNALSAGIGIQRALRAGIADGTFNGLIPRSVALDIGIGLHRGNLELGIVGTTDHWFTSVVSDVVDTAWRVQRLTRTFGAELLATRTAIGSTNDRSSSDFRRLGVIEVESTLQRLDVFEVLDGLDANDHDRRLASRATFETAVTARERGEAAAAADGFRACLDADHLDAPARNCLELLQFDFLQELQGGLFQSPAAPTT